MKDSKEHKEAVLAKLLPPHNCTITALARKEGISPATLYKWRNDARERGQLLPEGSTEPEGWSPQDKFNAVLETAALSETEAAEYCRRHGLYPEQIQRWRAACTQANDRVEDEAQQRDKALKAEKAHTSSVSSVSWGARTRLWPKQPPC